ncbi:MAG: polysaccharide deacetylase [Flavipsychrobacter sp.]|jgi:peptidoglycan/xylan/chitin deacetylase (PgdA/CDA1 family)|nr:polysaccharide deacetylase [Flavipsychrobacter sp.]
MNLSWLLPEGKGIPVLMYHKVWPGINDHLTIIPERLREHWEYLKKEGYSAISLQEYLDIISGKKTRSGKVILLTFDDGYVNNFTYVYPVLKEFGWQATFFIIGGMLDGTYNERGQGADEKMNVEQLRQLNPAIVQLAMHGHHHKNMGVVSFEETVGELQETITVCKRSGLSFNMVWAYAYGARPKGEKLAVLKQRMKEMGITAAFRIGNQVSSVPARDMYELTRIDIKGTDTIKELAVKLKKGKLKPF